MRTRQSKDRTWPSALALGLLCAAAACGDDTPKSGPKTERIPIEPDFIRLGNADPESDLPTWKQHGSYVLTDDREAHELRAGEEIVLPLPQGERACETAMSVLAPIEEARNVKLAVDFWLEEDGARRLLVQKHFDLAMLREHWLPIDLDFGHPVVRGAQLIVRASPESTQPLPPRMRLFLAHPIRTGKADDRPNLLIVSVDTLRADHLHCYGAKRDTSPNIDKLALKGALFEQAQSSAPWTLGSYGAFFSSRSPTVNRAGVQPLLASTFFSDGGAYARPPELPASLAPDLPVLAEILRDHGWATAGFHSNTFLRSGSGLERGFQRWVFYKWCADTAVDLALDWIGRRKGAPWFAFVHMIDPHQPYSPPPPFDRKFAGTAPEDVPGYPLDVDVARAQDLPPAMRQFFQDEYDGEIAWTDAQIGRLLDQLAASGALDNTIVLFHADHGEEFWDHGDYEHGHTVYQELLHVPLIMVFPGKIPAGKRITERVGLIDVMPTVLELLHLDAPKTLEGINIAPLFEDQKLPQREFLSECLLYGDSEAKALIVGNDKLIMTAGEDPMLFDLAVDPHEQHDLFPEQASRADALKGKLLRRARTLAGQAHESMTREFSEREKAELAQVGYAQGRKTTGDPTEKGPRTDDELVKWFGVEPDTGYAKEGVLVASVSPGSPADQAGIVKGDVLVRLGTAKLKNAGRYMSTLRKRRANEILLLKYVRNGQEQGASVRFPADKK